MRGGGAAGHSSRTRLLRSQPLPIVLALRQGCEQLGSIGGCGRIRTARAGQGRLAQGQEARSKQAASSKPKPNKPMIQFVTRIGLLLVYLLTCSCHSACRRSRA
jgi:hypothetical protein